MGPEALNIDNNPALLSGSSRAPSPTFNHHQPTTGPTGPTGHGSPTTGPTGPTGPTVISHTGHSVTLASGRPSSPGNESVQSTRSKQMNNGNGNGLNLSLSWNDILSENSIVLEDSGYTRIAKVGDEQRRRQ